MRTTIRAPNSRAGYAPRSTRSSAPLVDAEAALELFRDIPAGAWRRALQELSCLDALPAPALQAELARILGEPQNDGLQRLSVYGKYALHAFAGQRDITALRDAYAQLNADSPFRVRELTCCPNSGRRRCSRWPRRTTAISRRNGCGSTPTTRPPRSRRPAYVDFARDTLTEAARHVAAIHAGDVPIRPIARSRPTTRRSSRARRASRPIATRRGSPLIGPLLTGVCVAPTAAKTAPSQSLAIALGHAVETIPTPESVRALRDALATVRHAGVQKKLARNLKPAERALGERPHTALRMTLDAKPDKKQLTMLATCMEAGFWQSMTLGHAEWRERLVDAPAGAAFSTRTIWQARARDGATVSFMPDIAKGEIVLRDAAGVACELDVDSEIRLWHPLLADADERLAWQRAIVGRAIRQPVRQAFREFYVPADEDTATSHSAMFEGHVLASRPMLGVARREGWSIRAYDDGQHASSATCARPSASPRGSSRHGRPGHIGPAARRTQARAALDGRADRRNRSRRVLGSGACGRPARQRRRLRARR